MTGAVKDHLTHAVANAKLKVAKVEQDQAKVKVHKERLAVHEVIDGTTVVYAYQRQDKPSQWAKLH
jgi:hypothetical protein